MKKLILASKSPRRREILSQFPYPTTFITMDHEERVSEGDEPIPTVMALAYEKATPVADQYPEAVVIGADTVVVKDGKILGKPKDYEEAKAMLEQLSGEVHEVITGLAIISRDPSIQVIDYVRTQVRVKNMTEEDIDRYLSYGEYRDKAGAYGIQGLFSIFIEGIQGDYFNVVGLPVYKLQDLLVKRFDVDLLMGESSENSRRDTKD